MQTTGLQPDRLIAPCGGVLKDLVTPPDETEELKRYAESLPSISLSERSVCDLELLATGAFSPLDRFMGRDDYEHVLNEMRLANGHVFPIPITLPVDRTLIVNENSEIALRDSKHDLLAVMKVEDIYEWDRRD